MRTNRNNSENSQTVDEIISKLEEDVIIPKRSKNVNTGDDLVDNKLKSKKIIKIIIISIVVCILFAAIAYIAVGYIKYNGKFLPGTVIDGTDFSGMSVEEVCNYYDNKINNYTLNIYKDGYIIDKYEPYEFDLQLSYKAKWYFAGLVKRQANIFWLPAILGKQDVYDLNYMDIMSYNVHKLNFAIADSVGYNLPVTIKSRQGSIYYNGYNFVIVPPVASDQIEPATYIQRIYSSIQNLESDMIIEKSDCYVRNDMTPEIEAKLEMACKTASDFFNNIDMDIKLENSDKDFNTEIINSIYNIDAKYNFICNENTIDAGIDVIKDKYNDIGAERIFHTSHGTDVTVKRGDYGTYIDIKSLRKNVKEAVLNNKKIEATINYKKNTLNNTEGIGNTYIEIDLSNQYLYMYVDGELVKQCPVVTGLPGSRATPQGVYRLKAKAMNVPLVGDTYVTPVKYWMPFNGGIGLHDAVWQSYFGGDRYLIKGSHGCVNLSMTDAADIYKYAQVNMPVICYYHERIDAFKAIKSPDPVRGQYRALTAKERQTLNRIKSR